MKCHTHGVSEALYLRDPDDNGVELYWDRPQEPYVSSLPAMGGWMLLLGTPSDPHRPSATSPKYDNKKFECGFQISIVGFGGGMGGGLTIGALVTPDSVWTTAFDDDLLFRLSLSD
jgi:hypothetical protein